MDRESCIFCRIVRKEAEASIVYEDHQVMVFMDARPVSEGHMLIIPKAHFESVYDISEELYGYIHKTAKRIAVALRAATKADGLSIVQQNGKAAGQEVFHLHVHLIPRYEGQKMPKFGETQPSPREELDQIMQKIKLQL